MDHFSEQLQKGFLFLIAGSYNDAVEMFYNAVKEEPDLSDLKHGLIIAGFLADKNKEITSFLRSSSWSDEVVERVLELINDNSCKTRSKGDVLFKIGYDYVDNDLSILYFKAAHLMMPGDYRNMNALAEREILAGNYKTALKLYLNGLETIS